MANNLIQIKRTSVTGRAANSTTLTNAGELAINMTDGIMYSTNGTAVFEVGANLTNGRITNSLTLDNNKALRFKTVNTSAAVYLTQQSDDNFVLYTTDASYNPRAVFSIFSNSSTSDFQLGQPVTFNGSNVKFSTGTALYANGSAGSAGQLLTSDGTKVYWSSPGAAAVNTSAQYSWTNTHSFSANVTFSGYGIGLTSNTTAIYLGGITDANWKIGRNTGSTTKWIYSNNTLDAIIANSTFEGFVVGMVSGASYFETGHLGTFITSNLTIGNSSANSTINATTFSGTANNATNLGGVAAASYVNTSGSYTLTGTLSFNGNVNFDTGTLFVDAINNRVGISNSTGTNTFSVAGTSYFNGATIINGGLTLTGSGLTVGSTSLSSSSGTPSQQTIAGQPGTKTVNFVTGGNSTSTTTVYMGSNTANAINFFTAYANVFSFSDTISVGNSTVNSTINSTTFSGTANNATNLGGTAAASYQLNSTLNANIAAYLPTYTGVVNGATIQVGTSFTANATLVNTAAINVTNQVNSATIYATTSANIASAVQANATGLWTTGTVNAATVQTGTTFIANSTQVTIGAIPLYANSSSGTAGQVLTTSATGVYWAAAAGGGYYKGGSAAVGTLAVGGQNIFRVNANTLNNSTTIAAGENATAAGPLVVADGISLVVDTGGRVVIT